MHLAQTPSGHQVVLKLPRIEHQSAIGPEFTAQAEIARAFTHEHVVRVLESGRVSGSPFMALEYVVGQNLRRVVEQARTAGTRLELSVALRLTLQVCRALAAAHRTPRPPLAHVPGAPPARGHTIVHGDLGLENLLLSPAGQLKILPFGCAPPAPSSAVTQPAGQVVPLHLAPEVISGEPPSMASDLWSLGTLLYELLAPQLPDGFRTSRGPMGWWRLGLLPPLDQLRPDVPAEVAHLAAHLLETEPSRRLQRAEFVEEELVWALTTHGDRPGGRTGADDAVVAAEETPIQELEELDLDEDSAATLEDFDDTAGALGIQMVGAQMEPLQSAFTDTDKAMMPLRDQARDEGLSPPLVPDHELWIGPDDNPLLDPDAARATWMELQAWGESHEAGAEGAFTEDGYGLDGPVQAEEEDDQALWPTATHVPTLDGLKALDGPAIAAGLRAEAADQLGPDAYGPESHPIGGLAPLPPEEPVVAGPREEPVAVARAPMVEAPRRRKRKRKRRRPAVVAPPPRASRADMYFLVGSIALFLSALLLFFSVVLKHL